MRLTPAGHRRRDETGDGIIDALVGFLIFGILAAVIVATLTSLSKVTTDVSGSAQASALASRVIADAQAGACAEVTAVTSVSVADTTLSRCDWGLNHVESLADVVATDPQANSGSTAPKLCNASDATTSAGSPSSSVGTGACYEAANFVFTASLHFSWGWTSPGTTGATGTSSASGQAWSACSLSSGNTYVAPDELIRTAVVRWPDLSSGSAYGKSVTEVGAVPAALEAESGYGHLGGVVVDVSGSSPADVGMVVPGFPAPIVEQTDPAAGNCAVFPFMPAASSGYQVWVGDTSNIYTVPQVTPGEWTVVEAAP